LIRGEDLENVTIRGRGTIDGQGTKFAGEQNSDRPFGIRLVNCRNVLVENVSMRNSAMWMQHYLGCERIKIRGITVDNHVKHNNDGLNLDGCRDVAVSECMIDTEDDALCMKSTCDRFCENVVITNCSLRSHTCGIKMGTESNRGYRNVSISNCVISSPPRGTNVIYGGNLCHDGIDLLIVDGGVLENVAISNISMHNVKTPIFMRLGNRARPIADDMPKPGVGRIRNVALSNIVAVEASMRGCSILGLPGHPVENIQLSNIVIETDGGGTRENAERKVPELDDGYPFSPTFGTVPAFGFYCRHVAGLKLHDVRLNSVKPDARPAVIAEDVTGLVIDGLETHAAAGAAAPIRLIDCQNAVVRNSGDLPAESRPDSKK